MTKEGSLEKARGQIPDQRQDGTIAISKEELKGADVYRAIAGRAKKRADNYYDFILSHCNMEEPNLHSDGNLEIFVAWAAFACEVYLKCLLFQINAENYNYECPDGKKRFIEHSLHELFLNLKSSSDDGNNYAAQISEGLDNFEARLEEVSDYFSKYRYDFELNTETIHYEFVWKLMERLHAITEETDFLKSMEAFQKPDGVIVLS